MCKVDMLRTLLNQRLSAAIEEILVVFERTIADYEEELCRTKEENERQRQLLDAVFKPQAALHLADVNQDLNAEQQEWSSRVEQEEPKPSYIKEEEESRRIAPEPEQLQGVKFPVICVPVKSEDDDDDSQSDESKGAEPPSRSSNRNTTTESDRDHCGGSQADRPLAPLSDNGDTTSDTGDETSKSDMTCHTDDTHLTCPQCGKTFVRKSNLKEHMMIHTGEKPFVCSFCGKGFSQKVNMITHTRRHTGEKPYTCSLCSKSFYDCSGLVQHMRTHTGEKPFSCLVCGKRFRGKSILTRHIRTHTGEKVFSCSVCGRSFSYKYQLDKHTCAGESNSRT
ncbi:zinc finger protein 79-like isoform X2 [Phycodurus eques]|uniref:zinc finger protein 79-like isoform X2 n=1 Tax=Phycodurus eques TaxID=693459 RepID=UPI002ACD4084|nr:zinc finger protein 79-like isoform X2 [Phycodurus eques]